MTEPLPFKHPDAEVATVDEQLEAIATEIEAIQATAIVKIGEKLHEARATYRYRRDEGGFSGWVEKRLSMGFKTAQRFIQVYENLGSMPGMLDTSVQLSRKALYALAAPSTPPEVRDEVEALLIDGEKVTAADIRRMRDEARAAADGKTAAEREAERLRGRVQEQARKGVSDDDEIKRRAEAKAEEVAREIAAANREADARRISDLQSQLAAAKAEVAKATAAIKPEDRKDHGNVVAPDFTVSQRKDVLREMEEAGHADAFQGEDGAAVFTTSIAMAAGLNFTADDFWSFNKNSESKRLAHQNLLDVQAKIGAILLGEDKQ